MKKIDLHIHTINTSKDNGFVFDIEYLKKYVKDSKIDAIAITNHNIFDKNQYELIVNEVNCIVFPGIEVDLEGGHILVICPLEYIDLFNEQCRELSDLFVDGKKYILFEEFVKIFPTYRNYLLIPHLDKKPYLDDIVISKFNGQIICGEVKSLKSFIINKNNDKCITPLLFSDFREYNDEYKFVTRQTFIECDDLTIPYLKNSLLDKNKVAINNVNDDEKLPILNDGTLASTKINVILGGRSTGKTYLLESILKSYKLDRVKYIKQFSLVANSETEAFKKIVERDYKNISEEYLTEFKDIVNIVKDLNYNENKIITEYLDSLKEHSNSYAINDIYSKCQLFSEESLTLKNIKNLEKIVNSFIEILSNKEYMEYYDDEFSFVGFEKTIINLILQSRKLKLENILIEKSNVIIKTIKKDLATESAVKQIATIDLNEICKTELIKNKFNNLTLNMQSECVIKSFNLENFKVEMKRRKYLSSKDLNDYTGSTSTKDLYKNNYSNPFNYLISAKKDDVAMKIKDLSQIFFKLDYVVLNSSGSKLSGGEKAEYNLISELHDSYNYDMILIDEPESSFDNLFLKKNICKLINKLSKKSTIFMTTHNSTLGSMVEANNIIYTEKNNDNGVNYKVYIGTLSSPKFISVDNTCVNSYDILLNTLEAGDDSYNTRRIIYENIKNRK